MQTNIDIDDALMDQALRLSGLPTKKAAVEEALKLLILREQAAIREQASILELFGKIPLDIDLDASRRD